MTEALTVSQPPAPMRILDSLIGKVIPAVDIADNIGYTRSAITNIITKHEGIFKGFILKISLPTAGGPQEFLCLNNTGIDRLIFHLRPIKNRPELCERVELFRAKAFKELADAKESSQIEGAIPKEIEAMIRSHLNIADAMVEFAHVDRGIMTTVAIARVESETGADLSWLKGLVRKDRAQPPGLLNAGQVGAELGGLTATTINKMLAQLGYQYWAVTQWQPTGIGRGYGENIPFTVTHGTRA